MARYRGSVCRLCRRETQKLYLKGSRCYTDKCAVERRIYPPGQHGHTRGKFSDYGVQLREKQKVKRIYGLFENQFKLTYFYANSMHGISGHNLLILLESRLDNVVYRLGFANSRIQARHWVTHGHFLVNNKKVNIPSLRLKVNDTVTVREKSRDMFELKSAIELMSRRQIPSWLEIDSSSFSGIIKVLPVRDDITMPIQEQLIVEHYSR